jgi:hypothetical protein
MNNVNEILSIIASIVSIATAVSGFVVYKRLSIRISNIENTNFKNIGINMKDVKSYGNGGDGIKIK